ncbi:MAG: hypothetical protein EAZ27_13220 [Cytophagales bacterium]|nr:MAG: hypothetical protein EAZ27_13220 [Cytophagales bacterium]
MNLNIGKNRNKLEIGAGQTLFFSMYYQPNGLYSYSNRYNSNGRTRKDYIENSSIKSNITLQNTFSIGYKRMPANGGMYFKAIAIIFFEPLIINNNTINYYDRSGELIQSTYQKPFVNLPFIPYLGLSIGYCFKSK